MPRVSKEYLDLLIHQLDEAEASAKEWRESYDGLKEANADLKLKNAVLTERLDLLTNYFGQGPQQPSSTPIGANEEHEDLDYQFSAGILGKTEYEDALKAAGFDNTVIAYDAGDYSRM